MLNRKHIKAPKTYDPGPNRPTEHLAYMSKAEMEMLRVLTDGVVDRGPKGIPSFVLGGATTKGTAANAAMSSAAQSNKSSSVGGIGSAAKSATSKAQSAAGSGTSKAPSGGGNFGGGASKASSATSSGNFGGGGPSKASGVGAAASSAASKAQSAAKSPSSGAKPSGGFSQSQFGGTSSQNKQPSALGVGTTSRGPNAAAAAASSRLAATTPAAMPVGPAGGSQRPPQSLSGIGSPSSQKQRETVASALATSSSAQPFATPTAFSPLGGSPPATLNPVSLSAAAEPSARMMSKVASPPPVAPVSMSMPRPNEVSSFSKKKSWQTAKNASVMGSTASQKAMDTSRLGLPKEAERAMQAAQSPQTPPAQSFNYLDKAAEAIGLNERDKRAALQSYLKDGGVNLNPAVTAWCAAFVNATLKQVGLEGTGMLNARSFLNYGTPTDTPKEGDIAVFSRGDPNGWKGHVGFYKGMTDDGKYVKVLGGNQGTVGAVSIKNYPVSRLLGYRQVPGAAPAPVAQGPVPRPVPRPDNLNTGGFQTASERNIQPMAGPPPGVAPPRPTPRPPQAGLERNPFDTNVSVGVPRARPSGLTPSPTVATDPRASMRPGSYPAAARLSEAETYVDPSTGINRNPFDTQRAVGVPRARPPQPGLERNAFDTGRAPPQPGLSRNPFDAQRAPAEYSGYGTSQPPSKQIYGRVEQTPGPQRQYQLPDYPGRVASGTYTAPYDAPVAPRGLPLRGIDKLTELPPGYADRYGLNKPAEEAAPTRGWLEAAKEQIGGFQQAAEKKVEEVKQQIAEAEEKYGPITPEKIKLALLWNRLTSGGPPSKAFSKVPNDNSRHGSGSDSRKPRSKREKVADALAGTPSEPRPPSGSGFSLTPMPPDAYYGAYSNMTPEQALRLMLGEEWYA